MSDVQRTRLSVNMNPETAEALKEFASRRHISYTEAIRRVISIAKYITDEMDSGRMVQIVDEDQRAVRELLIL